MKSHTDFHGRDSNWKSNNNDNDGIQITEAIKFATIIISLG